MNAVVRFSWTIPLFGMKQMLDVMTFRPLGGQGTATMTDALNQVSDAARQNLGGPLEEVAMGWERVQKVVTEAVFRGQVATEPGTGSVSDTANNNSGGERTWGPIPPVSQ
jgi:hypothetical protein